MGNRFLDGLLLYLGEKVEVVLAADDDWQFNVSGSNGNTYVVEWNGTDFRCECPDFEYRAMETEGAFLCKHAFAAINEMNAWKMRSLGIISLSQSDTGGNE